MPCSSHSSSIGAARSAVVIVSLLVLATAVPAAAQSYCANLADTLLDTSDNCVAEPWRDRASTGVETFEWNGNDYMIFNRGNELEIHNINNPANPNKTDTSNFDFGNRGDSDYDLLAFDVCDDCRFGVLSHKLMRTVIFDLGSGGTPNFGATADYAAADTDLGGHVFSKGGQQYLLAKMTGGPCAESALYTLDGVSSFTFLECVEVGGSGVLVRGLQTVTDGGVTYLYAGGNDGAVHIFRADGSGAGLTLAYLGSPGGMRGKGYTLAIDAKNLRAASADYAAQLVSIWDLDAPNPGSPDHRYDIPIRASSVSLRSPSSGALSTLLTLKAGGWDTLRTYTVGDASYAPVVDESFWTDGTLEHNNFPGCVFAVDGALSLDGSVAFVSKFGVHQVFDLSECLEPTPAWADLSIAPSTVFPGQSVEVRDTTSGRVDEWALWITENGTLVAGNDTLNTTNPRTLNFTVPQDLAANVSYVAHIEVDSSELTPDRSSYDRTINIDPRPDVDFTIVPSAVIVGDTVTLTASAEGIVGSGGYEWYITDPDNFTTSSSGIIKNVVVDKSGNWDFELRVNYDHQDPDNPPSLYQATKVSDLQVEPVAADFTWTPSNPFHTQAITLDASPSKPSTGLTYEWQVERSGISVYDCPDLVQCVIPAETLEPDTTYTVTLTVSDGVFFSPPKQKSMYVADGNVQPEISVSRSSPEIGDDIVFTITGVPGDIESAEWDMGGNGCDGADSTPTCSDPNMFNLYCTAQSYSYSSSGTKTVTVDIVVGTTPFTVSTEVTVEPTGSCGPTTPPPDPDPCSYSVNPSSREIGALGGEFTFTVSTNSGCEWTASKTTPWITVLSPTGLKYGPGTVRYRVDENTGPEREGFVVAGGKAHMVTQKAPWVAANFTMSDPYPDIGEVVTFSIDPILEVESWHFGEANCDGDDPFINCSFLPKGACNTWQWAFPTAGEKNVTMVLTDDRTQTKHPVVQERGECCYADGRPDAEFSMSTDALYAGQTLYLTDLSAKALQTKALSVSWIPPNPDIGTDTTFTIEGTTGTISKATWNFNEAGCGGTPAVQECVPQGLWVDCTTMNFAFASGGDKTVSVDVEYAGGGGGSVGPFTVAVTNAGSCGGGGGGCSYSLSATSESFPSTGGSGSFDVGTGADCDWTATTTASWVSLESAAGTGPGTILFTVAPNLGTSTRSGTIKVEGKTFRVSQAADTGDTAPTEWRWTITRVENEEGESVVEDVFSSTDQNPSFRFTIPGRYRVTLVAINCYGSSSSAKYVTVLEAPVEEWVIGSAISKGGANDTQWESDFRFYNPCGEFLSVKLFYQPENQDNTAKQLSEYPFLLAQNETRVFASAREIVGNVDGEPINGSIRIDSSSTSGCKVMSVSRTFNDTPGGSLGLYVPAMPVTPAGATTMNFTGLIQNNSYRSNLRLVNHGDKLAWVRITAYDKDGHSIGESRTLKVYPRSTKQIDNVASTTGVIENLAQFTVQTEVLTADVVIDGLATVIDNISGDSVMNRSTYLEEPIVWLPGVTHASGVNNTLWQTDIWFHNPRFDDPWLTSRATYVDGGDVDINHLFETPEWPTLESMALRKRLGIVGNILEELGVDRTSGYLILEGLDGDFPPQVAARTFTSDDSGGTFGLHLPAFGSRDLLQVGDVGYVVGVSNSEDLESGFRTNLAMLATGRTAEVEVTFFYPDGSQAPEPWVTTVWPGQLKQVNNIFRKFGLGDETVTGTFRIEVLSGGNLAIYATEIDNQSGDSIFIPAQQLVMGLAQ